MTPTTPTFSAAAENPHRKLNAPFNPRSTLERSLTTPNLLVDPSNVPKEALLTAGKQMMGDMKDTFWTFVGDIRQATVGNEAMDSTVRPLGRSKSHRSPALHERKLAKLGNSSAGSNTAKANANANALITSQPRGRQSMTYNSNKKEKDDISSEFWREHGILESPHAGLRRSSASTRTKPSPNTPLKLKDSPPEDASWDMWGTPTPVPNRQSIRPLSPTSSTSSELKSGGSSEGTSSNFGDASSPTTIHTPSSSRDGWPPILKKLAPEEIKKSTAELLADWDRALSGSTTTTKGDKIGKME